MFTVAEIPSHRISDASAPTAVGCAIKFYDSLIFLPGGALSLALGAAAFFRKLTTGRLGILFFAHAIVGLIVGLAETLATAILVTYGPLPTANGGWIVFSSIEIWIGLGFTALLLLPTLTVAAVHGWGQLKRTLAKQGIDV